MGPSFGLMAPDLSHVILNCRERDDIIDDARRRCRCCLISIFFQSPYLQRTWVPFSAFFQNKSGPWSVFLSYLLYSTYHKRVVNYYLGGALKSTRSSGPDNLTYGGRRCPYSKPSQNIARQILILLYVGNCKRW